MGNTVDDKVVAMSFENSKFESGVKTTINTLDKLKNSLQFPNAGKGIDNVSRAFGHLQLGRVGQAVDTVSNKLKAFHLIGIGVLSNLAAGAVRTGLAFTKSLALGPIQQGLSIYQTKLQAIQTILANTSQAGTKMKDVTKALKELNLYSNKTIYSFGEMTKNVGTFTAAGVDLKTAVSAIKGIANLAALSGVDSMRASMAMYQLSQAISAGRVQLMDWRSVVNAGLGGAIFQKSLVRTAEAMGTLKENAVKMVGPMKTLKIHGEAFTQSLSAKSGHPSWLTSDVLVTTLGQLTGDLTDAQLKAEGFTKAQIKAIQALAQTALEAATKVKTFGQLMEVTKETIATGWAQTFEIVIGNLSEAKNLFTGISNSLNNVINKSFSSRNKILQDWKDLGGRTLLLDSLKNVFTALGDVVKPIGKAFREVFPRKTGQDLLELTQRFHEFTKELIPAPETMEKIRRTFAGIFAILDIGRQITKGIQSVFINLFKTVIGGNSDFLGLTAKIGDFLVALDNAIKNGKGLETFFNSISNAIDKLYGYFGKLSKNLSKAFGGVSVKGFSVNIGSATTIVDKFQQVVDILVDGLQNLGPAIQSAISNMNFELILDAIRTGLLAAMVLMLRNFIGGTTLNKTLGLFGNKLGKGFAAQFGSNLIGKLSKSFGSLGGTLKSFQAELKARTLQEIAVAIALLAVSLLALSLVKPERLNQALGAMTVLFGILIGSLVALDKYVSSSKGTIIKLPILAASLILLAVAIDLLVIAIHVLGTMKFGDLVKGLAGLAAALVILITTAEAFSQSSVKIAAVGVAIGVLGVGLNILALAIKHMGEIDMLSLVKGLGALEVTLRILAKAMDTMPTKMIAQTVELNLLAIALLGLSFAVERFGNLSLGVIVKGLGGIGLAIAILAKVMTKYPAKGFAEIAIELYFVGQSLKYITGAVGAFGNMSTEQLAKGIIALGGALLVLAIGLEAMQGGIAGSTALAIASIGIGALAKAMATLSKIGIFDMLKALGGMASALFLVAVAATLLQPAIPALFSFGAALIVIGAGFALVGAGIALAGIGIAAIVAALGTLIVLGPTGFGILLEGIKQFASAIPELAKDIALGILEIIKVFSEAAPTLVDALIKIITSLADAIIKSGPTITNAIVLIIVDALESIKKYAPQIIQAGYDILLALLDGINKNMNAVVIGVANIIVTLLNSLAANAGRIIYAGGNLVISLVAGVLNNIGRVINAGISAIINLVKGISSRYTDLVIAGGQAIAHFISGIGQAANDVVIAAVNTAIKFINNVVKQMLKMARAVAKGIVDLLNGVADIIDQYEPQIIKATARIGVAIVKGIVTGLTGSGPLKTLADGVKSVGEHIIGGFKSFLGIWSPAKKMIPIGANVVHGLIVGMDKTAPQLHGAVSNLTSNILDAVNSIDFNNLMEVQPTIRPVLDLSSVENEAKRLSSIVGKSPLGTVSLQHAAIIASKATPSDSSQSVSADTGEGTTYKFEQINNSPKALDEIEIYRQTKNLLSLTRTVALPR